MNKRGNLRTEQLRRALAQEAARVMLDQGIDDFLLAKRKAAERLHVSDASVLPRNTEIEAALTEYQRLFQSERHADELKAQRQSARELMKLLAEFQPRLVGSVLSGTASAFSEINVHVFTDQPELVLFKLMDHRIESESAQKKFRYEADRVISYPSFKFVAGEHPFEVIAFPANGIRQAPLSPVDGRTMQRAGIQEIDSLLENEAVF